MGQDFAREKEGYQVNLEQAGTFLPRVKATFANEWVYGEPFDAILGQEVEVRLSIPRPDTELRISVEAPDGTPARSHLSYRIYEDGQLGQSGTTDTDDKGQWTFLGPLASIDRIEFECHSLEGRFFAVDSVLTSPFHDATLTMREFPSRRVLLRFESPEPIGDLSWTLLTLGVYRRGESQGAALEIQLPKKLQPGDELVVRAKDHVELRLNAATLATLGSDSLHHPVPVAVISGTVVADDKPVLHAKLRISAKTEPGEWSRVAGGLEGVRWGSGHSGATVGKNGRFSYPLVWPGDWVMEVTADGFAPALVELIDFDPAIGRPGLIIELESLGRVVGRVIDGFGVPLPGARLVASHPLHRSKVTRADANGEYSLDLPPGPWTIVCPRERFESNDWSNRLKTDPDWTLPEDIMVVAGSEQRFDVHLPSVANRGLRVRFQGVEGRPASRASVDLSAEKADPLMVMIPTTGKLDDEGSAFIPVPDGIPVNIRLSDESAKGLYSRSWEPGTGELEWVIPTATLELTGTPSARVCILVESDSATYARNLQLDEEGRTEPFEVMAGKLSMGATVSTRVWRAELKPGEVKRLREE